MLAIDSHVLVLNKSFVPVGARPLRHVLKKLCSFYLGTLLRKAHVLDPETYETFTWEDWSRLKLAAPEIVVLSRYNDTPSHKIPFSRRAIYKRDHYTCQYCGAQPGPEELTIDHVTPKSRGGVSSWTNCCLACVPCNKRKADRTPGEAGMRLRHTPKRPQFMILPFTKTASAPKSWSKFVSDAFWDVELKD
jgi:hypothetical protein